MNEIPLHYVKKYDTGGGIFATPRVEIYLDSDKLNGGHPPYVIEYHIKILKQPLSELAKYKRTLFNLEYHLKKFESKDGRDKCFNMLKEALQQQIWMKPLQS